ncbi:MAG: thioredoxin domain-containing protein [Pseudomonadota bacterium]
MMKTLLRTAAPALLATLVAACGEAGSSTAAAEPADIAVDTETNWVRQIEKTEEGGYRIGNPDADVKLVEFASLSCSHCATFHAAAMTDLKGKYVASGNVSYELRPFILNQPDFVATMLARCTTPQAFYALSDAFFERQSQWLGGFSQLGEAELGELQGMEPEAAMARYGQLGGLDEFVRARGIPASKYNACVTDTAEREQLEAIRTSAIEDYELGGTPTFVLNGEKIEGTTWNTIEPQIQAAL